MSSEQHLSASSTAIRERSSSGNIRGYIIKLDRGRHTAAASSLLCLLCVSSHRRGQASAADIFFIGMRHTFAVPFRGMFTAPFPLSLPRRSLELPRGSFREEFCPLASLAFKAKRERAKKTAESRRSEKNRRPGQFKCKSRAANRSGLSLSISSPISLAFYGETRNIVFLFSFCLNVYTSMSRLINVRVRSLHTRMTRPHPWLLYWLRTNIFTPLLFLHLSPFDIRKFPAQYLSPLPRWSARACGFSGP